MNRPELFLGTRALELGVRVVDVSPYGVTFAVRAGAARSLEDAPRVPAGTHEHLRCTRPELERAAAADEDAACLLAALEARLAPLPAPRLMGIVNVTPDSFSDGGHFLQPDAALEHGRALAREGAALLDIGGESTRPGAQAVGAELELERVLPVVHGLASDATARVSIDTSKAIVARAALEAGATMVNDVSAGLADPETLPAVADAGASLVLMHMQGTPRDMQDAPRYADVVAQVASFLRERAAAAWHAGIDPGKIVLDPGIGFGKSLDHNLELIRRLAELRSLGLPLLLGVSRKSFIARVNERYASSLGPGEHGLDAPDRSPAARTGGSAAALAACVAGGAEILRVHDVALMAEAARVAHAVQWGARP